MRAEPETGIPWYVGDDQIKRLDADMARDGWRPVREHAPLTLDTLREAWESAIGFTTVHVGDTIIQRDTGGESFSVYVADRGYPRPPVAIRVLRRAPQPEPWGSWRASSMTRPLPGSSMSIISQSDFTAQACA